MYRLFLITKKKRQLCCEDDKDDQEYELLEHCEILDEEFRVPRYDLIQHPPDIHDNEQDSTVNFYSISVSSEPSNNAHPSTITLSKKHAYWRLYRS